MVKHKIYKVAIKKSDETNLAIVGIGVMDYSGHCISYGTYKEKEADRIIKLFDDLEASLKSCNVYGVFDD